MPLRQIVIALTLAIATTSVAHACPAGSQCLKYRHMQPMRATATTYVRATAGEPPARLGAVADFLTGSLWQPSTAVALGPNMLPALPLHFVDPRRRVMPARADERQVLVRRIERDTVTMVDVDGTVFELSRCRDAARRWTSCLTERDDLSFDMVDRSVDRRFSQPP